MAGEYLALDPCLTARLMKSNEDNDLVWHFCGWESDRLWWTRISDRRWREIVKVAHEGIAIGRGRSKHTTDGTLIAIEATCTAHIVYSDLVNTFIEINGFYDEQAYCFRVPLDLADGLVEVSNREAAALRASPPVTGDNLPF